MGRPTGTAAAKLHPSKDTPEAAQRSQKAEAAQLCHRGGSAECRALPVCSEESVRRQGAQPVRGGHSGRSAATAEGRRAQPEEERSRSAPQPKRTQEFCGTV